MARCEKEIITLRGTAYRRPWSISKRPWSGILIPLNALGQSDAVIESLTRGETAEPRDARIPYPRATILTRLGQRKAAAAAARCALEINPRYAEARELLQQLGE